MAKVLIIDSDAAAVQSLQAALEAQGIDSIATEDGSDAVALAQTHAPDVIVLCVELNNVSGYAICNRLKKELSLMAVPLILTSSQATEETFEQHKKLKTRADAYLKKPYNTEQILELIGGYIGGTTFGALAAEDGGFSFDLSSEELSGLGDNGGFAALDEPGASAEADSTETLTPLSLGDEVSEIFKSVSSNSPQPDLVLDAPVNAVAPQARQQPGGRQRESGALEDIFLPVQSRGAVAKQAQAAAPRGAVEVALESGGGAALTAPAAAPSARESRSTARSRKGDLASESSAESFGDERQMRLKVQVLEKRLEEKEVEFNDRLLAESERSREVIERKTKKLLQIERDLVRYQQMVERARMEVSEVQARAATLEVEYKESQKDRQGLSERLADLTKKARALSKERDELQHQLETLRKVHQVALAETQQHQLAKDKAKRAVDIALQLIDEVKNERT